MTTTVERPAAPEDAASPASSRPSRPARWWAGWRVALRLARRDAWRSKGRSVLVVLLIALPVGAVTVLDVYGRVVDAASSDRSLALAQLGTVADAVVVAGGGGPVEQDVTGATVSGGRGTAAPTAAALLAALPAGSRIVAVGRPLAVTVEAGPWGVTGDVLAQDGTDPLVAGRWRMTAGRLPGSTAEIALDTASARRIRVGLGASITVTVDGQPGSARTLTLVGLGTETSGTATGSVLPAALPASGAASEAGRGYLVASPRPLGWSDVRRLNAAGASVTSRAVADDPPAFCPAGRLCLDRGPAPAQEGGEPTSADAVRAAQHLALVAAITVLVVLQVALLAGPAFAVQLRRRQHELGLVGASGGDARTLRRTMLASGVVLGVAGAAVGVAGGWLLAWLLSGPLPWTPLAVTGAAKGALPPLPPDALGAGLIGVVAAVAAALVPAVAAGRGDVVDSLHGRRPLPPVRRRTPLLGLVLGAAGLVAMAYGATALEPVILVLGVICAELGLVVLMPAVVTATAQAGGYLPLAPRLAVRDAGRHRMRTAAAACAIAAAAAGSVAVSAWSQAAQLDANAGDVAYVEGTLIVMPGDMTDDAGVALRTAADTLPDVRRTVAAALPGATVAVVSDLLPRGASDPWGGDLMCVAPGSLPDDPASDQPCTGRASRGGSSTSAFVLLEDPATLDVLLGPLAPLDRARAALAAGELVVLEPGDVDSDGRLSLRVQTYDGQGNPIPGPLLRVPAVALATGAVPTRVVAGPAALRPGGALAGATKTGATTELLVRPAHPDDPDLPTAEDTVQLALVKAGLTGAGVMTSSPPEDSVTVVLVAGAAATALLAVLAGLMVTALAIADGRTDIATLAAVGAAPGVRRRIAAASAGFVSLLGCAVGAASGLLAARVLLTVVTRLRGGVFIVPWTMIAVVVIGVPVLTAGIAWVTTRPTIPLTRRS